MNVAQDGLLQVLAALEVMALEDILDASVEPLDHAVCLWPHRRGQAVLDAELGAEQVELVLSGGAAFAQAEQPVGKSLPSASSSPARAKRSAYAHPVPNLAQERPCHEQGRAARVNVIIQHGAARFCRGAVYAW